MFYFMFSRYEVTYDSTTLNVQMCIFTILKIRDFAGVFEIFCRIFREVF